jgi:hypothetical protein
MGTQMTKLPTPEQWVLSKMSEMEVAEMIERYIDYVDDEGRSVHLPMPFVRHYMRRDDNASPSESPPGCHRRIAFGKACSDRGES